MRKALPLVLGLVLLLPPVAFAQGEERFDEPGFYLGLGASFAVAKLGAVPNEDPGQGGNPGIGGGVQAFGGYRILPWLSTELQLEYLAGAFVLNLEEGSYRPTTLTANVKLELPTGEVRPFVSVGAGMLNGYFKGRPYECCPEIVDGTIYDVAMRYTTGVTFGGARGGMSVTFDFSYIQPLGDLEGWDYFSLGIFKVAYHF
jgi:hypothetical protein